MIHTYIISFVRRIAQHIFVLAGRVVNRRKGGFSASEPSYLEMCLTSNILKDINKVGE